MSLGIQAISFIYAVLLFICQVHNSQTLSRDSDSDDDVADELKADFVDEHTGELPPQKKSVWAEKATLPQPDHRVVGV